MVRLAVGGGAWEQGGADGAGWGRRSTRLRDPHCARHCRRPPLPPPAQALESLLALWHGQGGNKVLLFSNSVKMLRILAAMVTAKGYDHILLDGGVPQQASVWQGRAGLSWRAGGGRGCLPALALLLHIMPDGSVAQQARSRGYWSDVLGGGSCWCSASHAR